MRLAARSCTRAPPPRLLEQDAEERAVEDAEVWKASAPRRRTGVPCDLAGHGGEDEDAIGCCADNYN